MKPDRTVREETILVYLKMNFLQHQAILKLNFQICGLKNGMYQKCFNSAIKHELSTIQNNQIYTLHAKPIYFTAQRTVCMNKI